MQNKIYHFIPWSSEKNLGKCYNQMMSMLPNDDDWGCFLDGDAVHTTTYFGQNIENVIAHNTKYELFTCYTNRVIRKYQIFSESDWSNDDLKYHRELGEKIWKDNGTKVIDITDESPISGVLILIKKKIWKQVSGFKEEKMAGIDQDIHLKVKKTGGKVGLMKGIYVHHWYRGGDKKNRSHLL